MGFAEPLLGTAETQAMLCNSHQAGEQHSLGQLQEEEVDGIMYIGKAILTVILHLKARLLFFFNRMWANAMAHFTHYIFFKVYVLKMSIIQGSSKHKSAKTYRK